MFAVENSAQPTLATLPTLRPISHVHLSADDASGIVIAVQSVFRKLTKLQQRLTPLYEEFGFRPPSAGVAARDLSERIEQAIVQHCPSFTKGRGHCDLARAAENWEVKICQSAGLTINQSKIVAGEHYLVVNYEPTSARVRRVWVLWHAHDADFSARRRNSNARHVGWLAAQQTGRCELLFSAEARA